MRTGETRLCETYLEVLIGPLLFCQELVIDVLQTQPLQYASHFYAILHVIGEALQWLEVLLRSTVSHIGQMGFDLFDAFVVQLFSQNGKLLLQIACKQEKSFIYF